MESFFLSNISFSKNHIRWHRGLACYTAFTHVWNEVQEGISTEGSHRQGHKEAEQKLEEDSIHQRDQDDTQQGQQTDDGDGDKAPDPRWKMRPSGHQMSDQRQVFLQARLNCSRVSSILCTEGSGAICIPTEVLHLAMPSHKYYKRIIRSNTQHLHTKSNQKINMA